MLCEAVNTLFTEQCNFTKENLELFKQKVKCIIVLKNIRIIFLIIKFPDIAPPKCIQDKEFLFDDLEYNHLCILDGGEFSTVFLGKLTQGNQRNRPSSKGRI